MADAHGSGPCVRKDVRVQLPPRPLDVLRFHARGERGRWDISSMLWGCNPHAPPGGASPPGTPLSVVTFRGPRWALLRRPAVVTFRGPAWALLRRPAVVTFGAHCWGVASPPSGGHLRCSLLGVASLASGGRLRCSPRVVTLGGRLFWACFVAGSSVSCFLWAPVCRACHLGVVVEGRIVSWFGLFGGGFRHCQGCRRASGDLGHYLWGHGQLAGPPAGFAG
ncbi:MAG: hypothetical protein QOE32_4066 [Pseudonocardiales bacterium]|nr:hypothetical protein [Pseudonocardiales bacterium]